MGHLGDRYGRKRVLVLTVVMMGISTFLVGCLPTYADIGIWAPILLVALRLLQGFSASGEQAGGNSLSARARARRPARVLPELHPDRHAGRARDRDRRVAADRRAARRPAAVLGLADAVLAERGRRRRRRADPPPAGRDAGVRRGGARGRLERVPLGELLRDHRPTCCACTLASLGSTVSTIFAVYALSFAVDTHGTRQDDDAVGRDRDQRRRAAAIPLWATLADRVGRKPVFIFGALGSGALMFAYLAAIASGSYSLIFLAAVAMSGVVYSALNGVRPALYGEMFPTKVRLSGMAIGTQVGFAIGGFAPDGRGRDRRRRLDAGRALRAGVLGDRRAGADRRTRDVPRPARRARRCERRPLCPLGTRAGARGGSHVARSGSDQVRRGTLGLNVYGTDQEQAGAARRQGARDHLIFWVIKLLTTGMGEAMSDFLGQKSVPLAGAIGLVRARLALRLQLRHARVPRAGLLVRGDDGRRLRHHGGRRRPRGAGLSVRRHDAVLRARRRRRSSSSGTAARARCRSTASPRAGASSSTGPPCWRRSRSAPPPAT